MSQAPFTPTRNEPVQMRTPPRIIRTIESRHRDLRNPNTRINLAQVFEETETNQIETGISNLTLGNASN